MSSPAGEKIILITRPTRLADIRARFNTVEQARFHVERLGGDFEDYVREDRAYAAALSTARKAAAERARVQVVERRFLPSLLFGPQDIVVALGQDGLVANTMKYLNGQPVVGVNPEPSRWEGVLLPFKPGDLRRLLPDVLGRRRPLKQVTMAMAALNDGQHLLAVNDLFVGPKSHGSARYILTAGGVSERQSSSGVIISTGLGSTGWFRSLMTGAAGVAAAAAAMFGPKAARAGAAPVPDTRFPWDARHLFFTVREPFPTRNSGSNLVFGKIGPDEVLYLRSEMPENGVIFSDGIEQDFLEFNTGALVGISALPDRGQLVV